MLSIFDHFRWFFVLLISVLRGRRSEWRTQIASPRVPAHAVTYTPVSTKGFPDHHPYRDKPLYLASASSEYWRKIFVSGIDGARNVLVQLLVSGRFRQPEIVTAVLQAGELSRLSSDDMTDCMFRIGGGAFRISREILTDVSRFILHYIMKMEGSRVYALTKVEDLSDPISAVIFIEPKQYSLSNLRTLIRQFEADLRSVLALHQTAEQANQLAFRYARLLIRRLFSRISQGWVVTHLALRARDEKTDMDLVLLEEAMRHVLGTGLPVFGFFSEADGVNRCALFHDRVGFEVVDHSVVNGIRLHELRREPPRRHAHR